MIDEKKVIKKLQDRIDDFVLKHPDKITIHTTR